ncbi:cpw-wpc domain-containing protein [Toxoplasma gondii CAST]|uniref:Cpw-wpc domain-containing protein n=1 Tax=Toxoplasma gondii CAST TaxID=943122 RepID=A0A3R8AFL9_TOXGO|nr:cpw-wpc domain-containing protein [Toxoplasma gondii CAST]
MAVTETRKLVRAYRIKRAIVCTVVWSQFWVHCGKAARDYAALCPLGWFSVGDGDSCEAPPSYTGPCSTFGAFAKNSKMKKKTEETCSVSWPSIDECSKDYEERCPQQWVEMENGLCGAPASYTGRCERSYSFINLNEREKRSWERRCDVTWPCQRLCNKDYDALCPEDWISSVGGACVASGEYTGPCLPKMGFADLTRDMKKQIEQQCELSFPCKQKCRTDYAARCPEGWFYLTSPRVCSPPDDYRGKCQGKRNMAEMNETDRKRFSVTCEVDWPCLAGQEELRHEEMALGRRTFMRSRITRGSGPIEPETGNILNREL